MPNDLTIPIETFKKSYERMIRHETFSKYAKRTDNSKLRFPKELMIK